MKKEIEQLTNTIAKYKGRRDFLISMLNSDGTIYYRTNRQNVPGKEVGVIVKVEDNEWELHITACFNCLSDEEILGRKSFIFSTRTGCMEKALELLL